ncbi:MAG: hypothetical protein RIR48_1569 [Bacteroidota bacterium]|jgi:RNA recognition motif-containing protein
MEIYIGKIPFKWKEKNLEELFAPFCAVSQTIIIIDKITRQNKGFGFVQTDDDIAGLRAIEALNNQEIEGRNIIVSISTPKAKMPEKSNNRSRTSNEDRPSGHTKPKKKLPPWLRNEY